MNMKKLIFVIMVLGFWVSLPGLLKAQEVAVKGSIGGTVVDTTGAVIAGAKVTVNGALGRKEITTDSEGRFIVPQLTPGLYSVRAERTGFNIVELTGIEVFVGRQS